MILSQVVFSQTDANLVLGTWLTGSGNAKIEIYTIVALHELPKLSYTK